jgi:hypothetical protein
MDKNRRAAPSLAIAVAALAGIALLTPAPATAGAKGRQEKLQKRIDQLAAQMQADGTVQPASDCKIVRTGETRQIATLTELKRVFLAGNYHLNMCRLSGSQPARFAEVLRGATYFPVASNPKARVMVGDSTSWGRKFESTGPMRTNDNWDGSSYTTQPGYTTFKNSVNATAAYPGVDSVYFVLNPNETTVDNMRSFCNAQAKLPSNQQSSMIDCIRYHPETWDWLINIRIMTAKNLINLISEDEYRKYLRAVAR